MPNLWLVLQVYLCFGLIFFSVTLGLRILLFLNGHVKTVVLTPDQDRTVIDWLISFTLALFLCVICWPMMVQGIISRRGQTPR